MKAQKRRAHAFTDTLSQGSTRPLLTHCRTMQSTQLAGGRTAARGAWHQSRGTTSFLHPWPCSQSKLHAKAPASPAHMGCMHSPQEPGLQLWGALLSFKAPKSLKERLLHGGHRGQQRGCRSCQEGPADRTHICGTDSPGHSELFRPGGQWEPGGLSWTECLQPPGTSPPQHCLWDGPRQPCASVVVFSAPQGS